jgi:murein DD-endopeptidase MepM/ murein hydrolase activator NlpD
MTLRNGLLAFLWFAVPTYAAIDYITAFADIHDVTIWPTPDSNLSNVSSTFGPRIRASCSCDDFHRGIDIHGNIGDPVVASYGGKVVKLSSAEDGGNGGNAVVIQHAFDDWTTLVPGLSNTKRWYTLYLHLNDYIVAVGDTVAAGELIGHLGETGGTVSPHLHHEVRVGTRCSLEWAINNPSSKCNTKGYDPHVSPFLIYPGMVDTDITISFQIMDGSRDGIVHLETPDITPNVNKYNIEVIDTSTNTVVKSHTLDMNRRIGYDATSNTALDTFDKTKPYLAPLSFGYTATEWEIDLVVPASWLPSKAADKKVVVTVSDIWGFDQPPVVLADVSVTWDE